MDKDITKAKYEAGVAARYLELIILSCGNKISISHLQLLLYICYGKDMSVTNSLLIKDHPGAETRALSFPFAKQGLKALSACDLGHPAFDTIKNDVEVTLLFRTVAGLFAGYPE